MAAASSIIPVAENSSRAKYSPRNRGISRTYSVDASTTSAADPVTRKLKNSANRSTDRLPSRMLASPDDSPRTKLVAVPRSWNWYRLSTKGPARKMKARYGSIPPARRGRIRSKTITRIAAPAMAR